MARAVDERIIKMTVEDSNFKSKLQSAITSLTNFTTKLSSIKGGGSFDGVANSAAKASNEIAKTSSNTEALKAKFTALQGISLGALTTIGSKAVTTGATVLKSLTIDPVKAGFDEYQSKMQAVGVISANTGASMKSINSVLDDLNKYADKTSYSFEDMTKNMGTFTAAGVDLNTAATSIKGISNLAATVGSTSEQSAQAMYQLSQAISAGKVGLQDWNSVVTAQMGGSKFQNALIKTYKSFNNMKDPLKNAKGETISWRESLQSGWLSSKVLTTTLTQFANDKKMIKIATQAHTFKSAMDAIKEAAQSGWSKMWEKLIGGYDEATKTWTALMNTGSKMVSVIPNYFAKVGESMRKAGKDGETPLAKIISSVKLIGKSIKDILSGPIKIMQSTFKDLGSGGMDFFTKGLPAAFRVLASVLKAIATVLRPISSFFGDVVLTAIKVVKTLAKTITSTLGKAVSFVSGKFQDLASDLGFPFIAATEAVKRYQKAFTDQFGQVGKNGKKTIDNIKGIFTDFGKVIENIGTAIKTFFKALVPPSSPLAKWFENLTTNIAIFFTNMVPSKQSWITSFVDKIKSWSSSLAENSAELTTSAKAFAKWLSNNKMVQSITKSMSSLIKEFKKIDFKSLFGTTSASADEKGDGAGVVPLKDKVVQSQGPLVDSINYIKDAFKGLQKVLKDPTIQRAAITFGAMFTAYKSAQAATKSVSGLAGAIKELGNSKLTSIPKSISGFFDTIGATVKNAGLNAAAVAKLLAWALVIKELGDALATIGKLPVAQIQAATIAISVTLGVIYAGMYVLDAQLAKTPPGKMLMMSKQMKSFGVALMGMGVALIGVALAASILSKVKLGHTAVALAEVVGALSLLSFAASKMSITPQAGISLMAMSLALVAMGAAVTIISYLPLGDMVGTLAAMTGVIGILALMSKGLTAGSALSLFAMALGIGVLASSIALLSLIPLDRLAGGLLVLSTGILLFAAVIAVAAAFATPIAALGAALMTLAGSIALIGLGALAFAIAMSIASVAFVGFASGMVAGMMILIAGIGMIGAAVSAMGSNFWIGIAAIAGLVVAFAILAIPIAIIAVAAVAVGIALLAMGVGLGLIALVAVPAALALVGFVTILSKIGTAINGFLALSAVLMGGMIMIGLGGIVMGAGMIVGAAGVIAVGLAVVVVGLAFLAFGIAVNAGATAFQSAMVKINAAMQLIPGLGKKWRDAANDVQVADLGGKTKKQADGAKEALESAKSGMGGAATGLGKAAKDGLGSGISGISGTGKKGGSDAVSGLGSMKGNIGNVGKQLGLNGKNGTMSGLKGLDAVGKGGGSSFGSGLGSMKQLANQKGASLGQGAKTGAKVDLSDLGENAGTSFGSGLGSTINSIVETAGSLAKGAYNAIKKFLKIGSPSRLMKQIGRWTGEGLSIGMDQRVEMVTSTAKKLANRVGDSMQSLAAIADETLNNNMDLTPTVTPVLDASKLNGSANISTNATAFTKNSPYTGKIGTVSSGVTAQLDSNTISAISNGIIKASGINPADNAETNGLLRTLIATVDSSFTPDAARRAVEYSNSNRNSLKSMMMGGS